MGLTSWGICFTALTESSRAGEAAEGWNNLYKGGGPQGILFIHLLSNITGESLIYLWLLIAFDITQGFHLLTSKHSFIFTINKNEQKVHDDDDDSYTVSD